MKSKDLSNVPVTRSNGPLVRAVLGTGVLMWGIMHFSSVDIREQPRAVMAWIMAALMGWHMFYPWIAMRQGERSFLFFDRILYAFATCCASLSALFWNRLSPSLAIMLLMLSLLSGGATYIHFWIEWNYVKPFREMALLTQGPRNWAQQLRGMAERVKGEYVQLRILRLAHRSEVAGSDMGYSTPIQNEHITQILLRMRASIEIGKEENLPFLVDDMTRLLRERERDLFRAERRQTIPKEMRYQDFFEEWNRYQEIEKHFDGRVPKPITTRHSHSS